METEVEVGFCCQNMPADNVLVRCQLLKERLQTELPPVQKRLLIVL